MWRGRQHQHEVDDAELPSPACSGEKERSLSPQDVEHGDPANTRRMSCQRTFEAHPGDGRAPILVWEALFLPEIEGEADGQREEASSHDSDRQPAAGVLEPRYFLRALRAARRRRHASVFSGTKPAESHVSSLRLPYFYLSPGRTYYMQLGPMARPSSTRPPARMRAGPRAHAASRYSSTPLASRAARTYL